MSEIQKIGFGYVNDGDESLVSSGGGVGVFGLNTGVFTKLGYEPNAGKDGAPADAFDINIEVNGREYRTRLYDYTIVYGNNGEALTDPNTTEYIQKYNTEMTQRMAVITHAVKAAGVTDAQLQQALNIKIETFADWCKIVSSLVPQNYKTKSVHVFLEYQWSIPEGKDKTYLTLPKNMKGGRFLAPALVGNWEEQTVWQMTDTEGNVQEVKGLRYVYNGSVHPFTRDQNFMESNKAIQQTTENNANPLGQQTVTTGAKW
jgi:hypothetical protein